MELQERLGAFVDEFLTLATPNPLKPEDHILFDVWISIKIDNDIIFVNYIVSPTNNSGNATRLLNCLVEMSNKHQVSFGGELEPFKFRAEDPDVSEAQLLEFYRQFDIHPNGLVGKKGKPMIVYNPK